MYDTKISIVLLEELPGWQKLNVTAFLSSAVSIQFPETHGKAFVDQDKNEFMPFIRQPIMIFKAKSRDEMKRAFQRAKERGLKIGIYTRPLFATTNELQNLEIISNTDENSHDLVGLILYGDKKQMDKVSKGLKLHD